MTDFSNSYSANLQQYLIRDIDPAESQFLEMGREIWPHAKLLDLGSGAGRTTWVFGSVVDEYIGIDPVEEMVNVCRRIFPETERRRFQVGDARDLGQFTDGYFDAVLFSFNGMDHLDFEGRARALREIHRVLKSGGLFLFSSHNLKVFPFPIAPLRLGNNPRYWARTWRAHRREKALFERMQTRIRDVSAFHRGWAVLPDKAHGGAWELFYTTPEFQLRDLAERGFTVERITDVLGNPVSDLYAPSRSWWLHYFCRKI